MNNNPVTWRKAWTLAILLFGLAGAWLPVAGQAGRTVVEAVSTQVQGGVEVVRIDFSQPLQAVPAGFSIQAPARSALRRGPFRCEPFR